MSCSWEPEKGLYHETFHFGRAFVLIMGESDHRLSSMTSWRFSEGLDRWPIQVWKWFHTLKWTSLSQSEPDCSWHRPLEFCLCDQVRKNLIDRTWSFGTFRSAADLILGGAFLELNLWHSLYGRHHIWRVRYSIHLSSYAELFPLLPLSYLQTLLQIACFPHQWLWLASDLLEAAFRAN